jgi:CheY-like chemotaxis protein
LASAEVVHLAGRVEGVFYEDKGAMDLKNMNEPLRVIRLVPADGDPARRFASFGEPFATRPEHEPIRVLLADDSLLFREGLARLMADAGFDVVNQAADADELMAKVRTIEPDLVITDIRMPPTNTMEGLDAAREIRAQFPTVGFLALSQYVEARHAVQLLEGAPRGVGYVLKERVSDVPEFADLARRVSRGGSVIDPELCPHCWVTRAL